MSAAEFVEWQERAEMQQQIRDCVKQGMDGSTAARMIYTVEKDDAKD